MPYRKVGHCIAHNGRGYKIVADYEAETCQATPNYERATTFEFSTKPAMFYSLCYKPYLFDYKFKVK